MSEEYTLDMLTKDFLSKLKNAEEQQKKEEQEIQKGVIKTIGNGVIKTIRDFFMQFNYMKNFFSIVRAAFH